MSSFTPSTPTAGGTFTNNSGAALIVDSTYGTLGGTYEALGYGYGGFINTFGTQSGSVGAFNPGSAISSVPFTPQSSTTGSFTPS
jgi:hypothetical protein